MNDETTAAAAPGYPLRYDVEYPEELSRWLIFVKWLLAIPHFIILYACTRMVRNPLHRPLSARSAHVCCRSLSLVSASAGIHLLVDG